MSSHTRMNVCAAKNSCFVKAGGRFVTLHLVFFKTHSLIFYFDGEPGTMKNHDA